MGSPAATLFTLVQGAGFYQQYTREAVQSLPEGEGSTLLDVGCGPGLLTRLAAERGYRAIGIDSDPAMIGVARRIARSQHSSAQFDTSGVFEISKEMKSADVVAAASLLAVVPDPRIVLDALWHCVVPGGTLLIIEANTRMTVDRANELIEAGLPGPRSRLLRLWASGRQGATVEPSIFDRISNVSEQRVTTLLDGMVDSRLIRKAVVPSNTLI